MRLWNTVLGKLAVNKIELLQTKLAASLMYLFLCFRSEIPGTLPDTLSSQR